MSESCGSNAFPNAEGDKQKSKKRRTRPGDEEGGALSTTQKEKPKQPSSSSSSSSGSSGGTNVPETQEEPIVCTEEEKMNPIYVLQNANFLETEIHLLKKIIEEHVVPLITAGRKSYDNPRMWEFVCKQYNEKARQAGFEKYERRLEEVFAIGRYINWCSCPHNYQGSCECVEPKIPLSYVEFAPVSCSGSSKKRSHDSISAQSSSIEIRVAKALKHLRNLGHLTLLKSKAASVLYSNLINKGQIVTVEMFLCEENIEQQVALINEDLIFFNGYAEVPD